MKSTKTKNDNRTEWQNEAGKLHRTDGPAYEGANGDKEWYLNGREIEPWLLNTKIGRLLYG